MPGKRWVHQVPPKPSSASRMVKPMSGQSRFRYQAAPIPEIPAPTINTSTASTAMGSTAAAAGWGTADLLARPAMPASCGKRRRPERGDLAEPAASRSEEHTSELQSLMRNSYAVFCLKKQKQFDKCRSTHTSHKWYDQNSHSIHYSH